MNEFVTAIEHHIDQYPQSLPIMWEPRSYGMWYLSTAHEMICYEELYRAGIDDQKRSGILDRLKYGMKYALLWFTDSAKYERSFNVPKVVNVARMKDARELIQLGLDYDMMVCAFVTYWQQHARAVKKSEFEIEFICDQEEFRYDALDQRIAQRRAAATRGRLQRRILDTPDRITRLKKHYESVTKRGSVDVLPAREIGEKYEFVWEEMKSTYLLPSTWSFKGISIDTFRRFWCYVNTISDLHVTFCALAMQRERMASISPRFVIIRSYDSWTKNAAEYISEVEHECIGQMLETFSYDLGDKKRDPALQSFLKVGNGLTSVAPHIYRSCNHERNLIMLLAGRHQDEYNATTGQFENQMADTLSQELKHKGWDHAVKRKIRGHHELPDIDIAIYDRDTCAILLVELKWVIPPAELSQKFRKVEREAEGIKQVRKLLHFAATEPEVLWSACFPAEKRPAEIQIFGCVVMAGFTGSSYNVDPAIPVAGDTLFIEGLRSAASVTDLVSWMRRRDYLPRIDTDFRIKKYPWHMGPYTVHWYGWKWI